MLKLYTSACASHCTASHFDLMQVFLSLSSLSLLPSSSSSSSFVCMCSKASRIDCLEIPNQQRDHIYISHCIDCGVDSLPLFHILTKAVGFLFCYWALLSMRIIIDRTIQFHVFAFAAVPLNAFASNVIFQIAKTVKMQTIRTQTICYKMLKIQFICSFHQVAAKTTRIEFGSSNMNHHLFELKCAFTSIWMILTYPALRFRSVFMWYCKQLHSNQTAIFVQITRASARNSNESAKENEIRGIIYNLRIQ